MSALLWALLALPLTAGTALAVTGRPADRCAPAVAVTASVATLGLAVAAAYVHPRAGAPLLDGAPAGFGVDGLAGLTAVTVAAVTVAVLVFSTADLGPREARARFHGLMLLFAGAMLATVTATTLPVLLMAWEVMGATSWALIGYWWHDPDRVRAATTAFLTTRAADLGLYLAAGAALASGPAGAGSLRLDATPDAAEPWRALITAGVVTAALGKSAQLPFGFWLSRAMQGPSPVSALLHSAAMVVAGAYLLLRLEPLLRASGWGGPAVAWAGALTAVAFGLVAVAQTDLKQLLAGSSCAQIGFMVLAAGVGSRTGGTLQLVAHAAAKSLAFLVAGVWLTALGTRSLHVLRGRARRYRTAALAFTAAALTLAGVPPLALWAAKDVLLTGARQDSTALYAVGLAGAVLSAAYSGKALWFVLQPADGARHPLPYPVRLPLLLLSLACLALTVLAFPPVRYAVARVVGGSGSGPQAWEFALSGALAVAVVAAFGIRGERLAAVSPPWLRDWLGLEAAARLLLVRPVLRLARALAAFDDRVPARAARGAARGAVTLARWTDRRPEFHLDGAVAGVAHGARTLGRWARRPQTGQLHQYLAQAVAAFTVLAVVLVLVR
ncbi:proton-conducting transporter transmembrane domain-containing protein [Streptomyces poriticola]|uniref:proton-conducting transporter transmembrane domain-containing protein n=1 Tax=Streptomyces poriticola TaxID=3120506 RepID=UPI002FCE168E